MSLAFYERVTRLLRAGRAIAVATVVHRQGSTPREFGAKMIITGEGDAEFSIGGGAFEALVIEDAREALRAGRGLEKEYRFSEQGEGALGMVCGGTARVLVEILHPPAPLLIFGAGHVGREVGALGTRLGFHVTLIDDRPRLLDPSLHAGNAALVRVGHDFADGLPPVAPGAYVVVVTRCHRTDLAVVRHAVGRGAAYVGMIGSRRKVAVVRARAEASGVPRRALAELRAPIGVSIGAETPEEIAVSIAAEMIAVRRAAAPVARDATITPIDRGRDRGRRVRAVSPAPPLRGDT